MDRDSYNEFKEALKGAITGELPGVEINESSMLKRNNLKVDAFTINDGSDMCPVVYPKGLYESFNDGVSIERIAKGVAETLHNNSIPEMPEFTREEAEKHISISLLNTKMNKELLETCPNRVLKGTDLSEVIRWHLNEECSFLVKNEMMSDLQMTKEELFNAAKVNLSREQFSIKSMQDTIKDFFADEGLSNELEAEMMPDMGTPELLVVSRESKCDGSAAMASDKVMQAVYDRLNEDFFILPSSRHEIICLGKSSVDDPRDLKKMVGEVNESCLKPDDYLSDNTFKYSGMTHSLSMCDEDGVFMETSARQIERSPKMAMGGI